MNQSTMLAQRTQKLIEEIKPDTVLVQTSPEWWSNAKMLGYVHSQEEMNNYAGTLDNHNNWKSMDFYYSNRKWLFLARMWTYTSLWRRFFFGPNNFHMMRPGLEMKYACESAEKVGAKLGFLGAELDQSTWQRMFHEKRMNVLDYMVRRFERKFTFWMNERLAFSQKLACSTPASFSEKCLDAHAVNWVIQATDAYFPNLKKIFVD